MKIGLVVPHIFMQDSILQSVIFSPAELALQLASGLQTEGHEIRLYTPGPVTTPVDNVTGDMSGFEEELTHRGYGFLELLKKHPLTFASLARQVQSDLLAQAYEDANKGVTDIVHVYSCEEDIGLQFVRFCMRPIVFTHHDPFNLTSAYRVLFPRKRNLNYIALSESQKQSMPSDTNWLATIPHGLPIDQFSVGDGNGKYVLYMGRIIESKGVHHAVAAVHHYNKTAQTPLKLKIAGKYYQEGYFEEKIQPFLNDQIEYIGYAKTTQEKQVLYGNAVATIMPSVFDEPFGLVAIESLACGTPVIGLASGALPEIIEDGISGFLVEKSTDQKIVEGLSNCFGHVHEIDRSHCRRSFENNFTSDRVITQHVEVYTALLADQQ